MKSRGIFRHHPDKQIEQIGLRVENVQGKICDVGIVVQATNPKCMSPVSLPHGMKLQLVIRPTIKIGIENSEEAPKTKMMISLSNRNEMWFGGVHTGRPGGSETES